MKNVIIIIILLAVGVLGYRQFTNDKGSVNTSQQNTGITSTANGGDGVDLSSKGLTEFPKNVLTNESITSLDISNNKLTGALPSEIRQLKELQTLDASDNDMTGIPAEIGQLTELRFINFANNNLSGLPLEIGNLHKLETIDLRGNVNVSQYDIGLIRQKIPSATILTD